MQLETVNKLYLELSQIATAKTNREIILFERLKEANDILRSTFQIASRKGAKTNWDTFTNRVQEELKLQHRIIYPAN